MKLERRFLSEPVAVEQVGNSKKIKGYAAKFNTRSFDLGGFVEEIDPKAFDRSLQDKADTRALWNHDTNHVLGRVKSKTLELTKDSTGLHYEITPPDTQVARDLMVSMERGDIDNSSFGFVCVQDDWFVEKDGTVVRRLLDVELYDVSPTTFPAYPDATSQVRSLFPESEGKIPAEIEARLVETRARQASEKRYRGVLSAVAAQRWAIQPEKLATIVDLLNARASGVEATKEEIRAALDMQHGDTPDAGSVALIPVYGVIAQRMGMFDDFSGGTSCEAITKAFRAALTDENISAIVFDVDSPGGTVTGVPELAAEIYAARGKKPIIAVANGMAASAAYWIASAAEQLVVIPSGEVGSIGVYTTHQDVSELLAKEGVKITFVQAGKYKTDGNPYEPLSASAEADMQDGVNKFYDMFTRGVAGGRNVSLETVLSDFGQGRMLLAEDAVKAGMADKTATLDEVLAGLKSNATTSTTGAQSAAIKVQATANPAEVRDAGKQTKRVDNEDLPKESFAYQGSDKLDDWKLPIKFSTEEKTVKHIRNAISQWPKTDMPNASEKKKARSRVKAAAKAHGIQLAPGDLALHTADRTAEEKRSFGDDDYYGCNCACNACMAGNCEHCEDAECKDENCMCCGFDRNAPAAQSAVAATVNAGPLNEDDPMCCNCQCASCVAGNCSDCDDEDCDDQNCDHDEDEEDDDDSDDDLDDGDQAAATEQMRLELALKMRQAGVSLPK